MFGNLFGKKPDEIKEVEPELPIERTFTLTRASVESEPVNILETYAINEASVTITGDGYYLVREPAFSETAREMYNAVLEKINTVITLDVVNDSSEERISKFLTAFYTVASQIYPTQVGTIFPELEYYVKRDLGGYQLIDVLMKDKYIEDIMIIPDGSVFITHKIYNKSFDTMKTNIKFSDMDEAERFIQKVYGRTGSEPTKLSPIGKTEMEDGSRISCNIGTDISHGPNIAIRKFSDDPFTVTDMMKTGTITTEMCAYLWTLLDARAVGLVIGVTGSGKTTLMGSLITMMNPFWRILTIEDTYELRVPHENWTPLRTRKSSGMINEEYNITVRKLLDMSLTQRPDFEIIGETRMDDMDMLFQSVGTGHGGLCLPGNEKMLVKINGVFTTMDIKDLTEMLRNDNDSKIQAYSRNADGKCEWKDVGAGIIKSGNTKFVTIMTDHTEFSTHEDHPITVMRGGKEETMPAKDVIPGDFSPRPGKILLNDNIATELDVISYLPEKWERIIIVGNGKTAGDYMNAGIGLEKDTRIRAWGGRKPTIPAVLPMGEEMGKILAWCALGKPRDITKDIVNAMNAINIEAYPRKSGSIRIHSEVFQWLLQKLDIKNSGFPDVLFNASLECRLAALKIFGMYPDLHISKSVAENICILAATCGITANITVDRDGVLNHRVSITNWSMTENVTVWDPVRETRQYRSRSALYDIVVPGNENFCHGTGAFTHNTSFHAANAEGAISRLRGEGITDGSLGLLWFVVQCNKLKVGGSSKRRVMDISEVNVDNEGKIHVDHVYKYDIFTDTFNLVPEDLFKTKKYKEAQELIGIVDPDADFKERVKLLQQCIDESANDPKSVFRVLKKYYVEE